MIALALYLFVALFFSFLCSIAEAVILSVRPSYVVALEQEQPQRGKRLRWARDNLDQTLAAILSLNTIAHTVGAVGTGGQAAQVFGSNYVGIFSAVLTLLILIVSEIIPKTLGANYWRQLAPSIAGLLIILVRSMMPFVWLSRRITTLLSPAHKLKSFSREEFAAMVDIGHAEGLLAGRQSRMLKTLLRLDRLGIRSIMTPRQVIFSLPSETPVTDFVRKWATEPFSRIPIYDGNPDEISGFVLKMDLLLAEAQGRGNTPLKAFSREIPTVPDTLSFPGLFQRLLQERIHIALIVDEYGSVEGLVTLEDVVESLIGLEIVDETDKIEDMQTIARTKWKERARKLGIDPNIVSSSDGPG